jgi:hypothetical protein
MLDLFAIFGRLAGLHAQAVIDQTIVHVEQEMLARLREDNKGALLAFMDSGLECKSKKQWNRALQGITHYMFSQGFVDEINVSDATIELRIQRGEEDKGLDVYRQHNVINDHQISDKFRDFILGYFKSKGMTLQNRMSRLNGEQLKEVRGLLFYGCRESVGTLSLEFANNQVGLFANDDAPTGPELAA